MSIHPNDAIYALDRAIFHSTAAGEAPHVISDMRQIRDMYQQAARAWKAAQGLNLPNLSTEPTEAL